MSEPVTLPFWVLALWWLFTAAVWLWGWLMFRGMASIAREALQCARDTERTLEWAIAAMRTELLRPPHSRDKPERHVN